MKKSNLKTILSVALALVLCLFALVGCGSNPTTNEGGELAEGGVLVLSVNPEIAVTYDADGNVTKVTARNDDAKEIIAEYAGYEGKACKAVVSELVAKIGEAGYLVEEIEGEKRQITIEIEPGSKLPNNNFLDEVANEVRDCVNENKWNSPVDVKGESDYGITDYIDTDYGPNNDGVTDYDDTDYGPNNDGVTDYDDTDYGPNNDGVTDYDDTDYGPNNDGVTDYDDTDYGPNNDGVTDYDDTDYGPNNDGVTDYSDYGTSTPNTSTNGSTDYDDTDYGPDNDGVTDYDDTDYGPNNDGVTDYNDTDYGPNNDGVTDYDDSDYGSSNYDDGNTDYDNTDYGDSDYDD